MHGTFFSRDGRQPEAQEFLGLTKFRFGANVAILDCMHACVSLRLLGVTIYMTKYRPSVQRGPMHVYIRNRLFVRSVVQMLFSSDV